MHVRTKLEQTSDVFNQNKDKTTDPRVARIIKYLAHVSVYNPDLHYKIIMGSCMEAEAELERHAIKQTEKRIKEAKKATIKAKKATIEAKKATIEAKKATIEAKKAKAQADLKCELLKIEHEKLRLQLQNKQ